MQIGVIGLGRMGGNISRRLMKAGHTCIVFDANAKPREALAKEGATAVQSLEDVVKALKEKPRAVWVMLPAGQITETTIGHLGASVGAGRHHHRWRQFILQRRYPPRQRIGREGHSLYRLRHVWRRVGYRSRLLHDDRRSKSRRWTISIRSSQRSRRGSAIFRATPGRAKGDSRAERGYIHAGPAGAGHFVKMVHNGIEYGLMQAYAEGFDILRNKDSKYLPEDERFTLNLPDIAEVWRRGSVISSWLLDLSAAALAKDPQLKDFSGFVQDSGEGRWTVEAAIEEAVPADVLSSALYARFRSRQQHTFGEKMLSAMRFGFGGHIEGQESIDPEPKLKNRRVTQPRRMPRSSVMLDKQSRISSTVQCGRRAAAAAGHSCRSLRHGRLRRQRRSDQASGGAGPLQPRAHQVAAGEFCADRRRAHRRKRRKLARPPYVTCLKALSATTPAEFDVDHIDEDVWKQPCREDVLHPWRPDQARGVREASRRPGQGRKSARHTGQCDLLSRGRRWALWHRGG